MMEQLDFGMLKVFTTKLTDLLRQYYFVGGMPEVVKNFLEERDFAVVQSIQKQLLDAYEQDFSKHAPNRTVPRIMSVWNSLPAQIIIIRYHYQSTHAARIFYTIDRQSSC